MSHSEMRKTELDADEQLARLKELEDRDDDDARRERAEIMLAQAAKAGWLSLLSHPDAANFLTVDLHTRADDPAKSVVRIEVGWRAGKTAAERITELEAEKRKLEREWREMKARLEALEAGGQ